MAAGHGTHSSRLAGVSRPLGEKPQLTDNQPSMAKPGAVSGAPGSRAEG